ncbi:hypothetical protein XENOCAPTIV_017605 [Xenoophorus captivus]|uniref:Uncharacterized protein n=1 Tax=Xenoophorus captivus TaxID=1517983 RepID=A0ABV0QIW2_9TELE
MLEVGKVIKKLFLCSQGDKMVKDVVFCPTPEKQSNPIPPPSLAKMCQKCTILLYQTQSWQFICQREKLESPLQRTCLPSLESSWRELYTPALLLLSVVGIQLLSHGNHAALCAQFLS